MRGGKGDFVRTGDGSIAGEFQEPCSTPWGDGGFVDLAERAITVMKAGKILYAISRHIYDFLRNGKIHICPLHPEKGGGQCLRYSPTRRRCWRTTVLNVRIAVLIAKH